MRQQLQIKQSLAGSRRWLSALIAAMEASQRPELRRRGVPADTHAQFRARLALPAAWHVPVSRLRH
jgi:hypothetical protein